MDKQEYKILSEEIMTLVANERFVEAVEIADRIDWRKVRSFSTLQKISELYRINCRFDEAMDIMLMAYDKNPNSRTIVYSLCELSIDLDDLVAALQYLALYKKMAPGDKGGLILQYKILEMQNAKTEEKIELLEELNHKDYTEEWAYQLAYLYHRIGLATKCVETCDQLITWFGYGPFVIKAIELKMLHAPLTEKQKEIYDSRNEISDQIEAYESDDYTVERAESSVAADMGTEDFHVKTIDMSKFNTINLQKALAESMRELMGEDMGESEESPLVSTGELEQRMGDTQYFGSKERADHRRKTRGEAYPENDYEPIEGEVGYAENSYEPIEGERGYAENSYEPVEGDEGYAGNGYEPMEGDEGYAGNGYEPVEGEVGYAENSYEPVEGDEGYAGNGYEPMEGDEGYAENGYEPIESEEVYQKDSYDPVKGNEAYSEDGNEVFFEDKTEDIIIDTPPAGTVMPGPSMVNAGMKEAPVKTQGAADLAPSANGRQDAVTAVAAKVQQEEKAPAAEAKQPEAKPVVLAEKHQRVEKRQMSNVFDNVLSQGMDGQISLVVPEDVVVEKQITGQMNLQELFLEWENVKRRKEEERRAKTSKDIIQETGKIFAEFEAGARSMPLAKIEEESKMFSSKFRNSEDIELRSVDELEKISYTQGSIWDEVDAAIEADKKKAEGIIAGTEDGESSAEETGTDAASEDSAEMGVDAAEVGAAALAGAAVGTVAGAIAGTAAMAGTAAEAALVDGVTGDLSAIGQAASVILNGEGYQEALAAGQAADVKEDFSAMAGEAAEEGYDAESGMTEDISAEGYYSSEDAAEDFASEYASEEWAYDSEAAPAEEYVAGDGAYEEYEGEVSGQTEPINEQVLNTSQISDIESALEAQADKVGADTADEDNDSYSGEEEHYLTLEEQELFSDFMYSKKMRTQILDAIDQISLAPYVGNIIITGDSGTGVIELAKTMIREIQMIDNNFNASKVAKISGDKMNRKDLATMFEQLTNGALIIERAGAMTKDTLEGMSRILEGFQEGIIIIMTDRKKEMEKLIDKYDLITGYFNARIDIKPMNDNALVDYAKKYAHTREYKIDEERAVLALHRRINELQIGEHNVTTREIEDIIDEAIERSKRLRISTYIDILVGKRYDYEDMIILKEKDFD